MKNIYLLALLFMSASLFSQGAFKDIIAQKADAIDDKVIEWRRHLHEHPELSNREYETAAYVAEHLRALGLEVKTEVGHTGVVGILRGGKAGKTVALRADMDALPVTERVDVPFASKVQTEYLGKKTGVMHACGHDTHVAMLMGAAEVLSSMKKDIPGTVVFIFQPAEEGAPPGEEGGAELMVKEGVLKDPAVDAAFGIHISSQIPVGEVFFKAGGAMAAANRLTIKVKGKQTHGSTPWTGVDPITVSAQIIMGLQTIVSRQVDLTKEAAVISIGKIQGGVRNNIIPEEVEMIGTIRTLDPDMQKVVHERIRRTVQNIAEASGAVAEVEISRGYPITFNDLELTKAMVPTLQAVAGKDHVVHTRARTGAEDFSFYANEIPALFVYLGGMPADMEVADAAPHHTPDFYIDDSGLHLGVKLHCNVALDYLLMEK